MPSTFTSSTGKVFTYAGDVPYTRKSDGSATTLRRWTAPCSREGCDCLLEIFTPGESPIENLGLFKQFQRQHCDAHKCTPAEALARARASLKQKAAASRLLTGLNKRRAKVSDTDVAEIRRAAAEGFKPKDIMLTYDLAESTIRSIINGTRR